eukprot:2199801-Rhodomonas_salina.2
MLAPSSSRANQFAIASDSAQISCVCAPSRMPTTDSNAVCIHKTETSRLGWASTDEKFRVWIHGHFILRPDPETQGYETYVSNLIALS